MDRKFIPTIGVGSLGFLAAAASLDVSAAERPPLASVESRAGAARCAQLVGNRIAGGTVDKANFVTSGSALTPFNIKVTTDFCRVDAKISGAPQSQIKVQVWMPWPWNGKLVGVGGGGFEGSYGIASVVLPGVVNKSFAGVVTNAGHDLDIFAQDPKWALISDKLADYGNRANHLGAIVGKSLVSAYYGIPAKRSYFHGCSNGGRDALMLAQRYPDDFDAIAVGAPANDFTALMAWFVRAGQLSQAKDVELSAFKMNLINAAAVKKCDALDGVTDSLIERPLQCRFDPGVLQCAPGEDTKNCLSSAEISVAKAIYRGAHDLRGRQVMPGPSVGSEYEWDEWLTTPKANGPKMGAAFYRYMVYKDPSWTAERFEVDRDLGAARKRVGPILDANNRDLRPFLRKGGKLLMYHGWDDAAIPAENTLRYFSAMKRATGRLADRQTRLFMLPGVAHCSRGNGPSTIDYVSELDRWSETGSPPDRIIATKHDSFEKFFGGLPAKVVMTRPVCAWPKAARYKGSGPTDEAANFVCK